MYILLNCINNENNNKYLSIEYLLSYNKNKYIVFIFYKNSYPYFFLK